MAPELTQRAFFGSQVFFGQIWENPGKIPSHPPKFARSYTYVLKALIGLPMFALWKLWPKTQIN